MKYDFNKLKKSNNGVVFMASTLGIFILLSFFAFFLARFSATETRSSSYHIMDIKARNLSLLGLEHGMQSLRYSYNILLSQLRNTRTLDAALSSRIYKKKSLAPPGDKKTWFLHREKEDFETFLG